MAAYALGATALASQDPLFAAIEEHAKAYAALDDDPSWVALQLELDALDGAESRAVAALIWAEPSTAAGAVALTRHVILFSPTGVTSGLRRCPRPVIAG